MVLMSNRTIIHVCYIVSPSLKGQVNVLLFGFGSGEDKHGTPHDRPEREGNVVDD